jgi:triacylglycerol lipase
MIPLKYPVVLVHGVDVTDKDGGKKSWGRIPEVLAGAGIDVFLGNTDAWGSYESNAAILKNSVEGVLSKTRKEKVNIISHSKGGIDSRYFIWKYDFGDKVASLTTICTPHHGSEISDMLCGWKLTHTKFTKKVLSIYGKFFGDTNPDLYSVNNQLTTEKMKEFNEKVVMHDRVFYQNFYVTVDHVFDDIRYFFQYLYLKKTIGKNDGVVSERSADWGSNTIKIADGISHSEIRDAKKKKISGLDIPDVYIKIVSDLSKRNF